MKDDNGRVALLRTVPFYQPLVRSLIRVEKLPLGLLP